MTKFWHHLESIAEQIFKPDVNATPIQYCYSLSTPFILILDCTEQSEPLATEEDP